MVRGDDTNAQSTTNDLIFGYNSFQRFGSMMARNLPRRPRFHLGEGDRVQSLNILPPVGSGRFRKRTRRGSSGAACVYLSSDPSMFTKRTVLRTIRGWDSLNNLKSRSERQDERPDKDFHRVVSSADRRRRGAHRSNNGEKQTWYLYLLVSLIKLVKKEDSLIFSTRFEKRCMMHQEYLSPIWCHTGRRFSQARTCYTLPVFFPLSS